ncbi:4Fe-4S ferredoxin, iron-sulfur binding domain protein [Caldicellulosiruptor saccharolyticus DSM 8903]|uniref:4Fe-4S ferredoxin, iron-sulfur binding domain protein n=1 Tax=Caldicellulosiruptor saccharolyticus (strain ATCC 43494 / DSM 8903 / Tp8T 6331) TaxID=351627 RepID=A4XJZ6_CALS8|nr:ferredoxin family protein [Caldicellulosiruptor saccharolyticus]ABP67231.1 4Fe-4S ferredoxin, iron-sulfur binding domain protein [Caldicellulosiruptor saccharolyticus DSM 8903]
MSIRIDRQRCIGCGKCAEICPGNLIVIDEDKKAFVRDPRDCWGCAACVKECKFSAIRYFLGAEIGGNGTTMYVEKENDEIMYWYFEKPSGEKEMIVQNLKDNTTY